MGDGSSPRGSHQWGMSDDEDDNDDNHSMTSDDPDVNLSEGHSLVGSDDDEPKKKQYEEYEEYYGADRAWAEGLGAWGSLTSAQMAHKQHEHTLKTV